MSFVSLGLWHSEFPDIAMPENCEYFDFVDLVKVKNDQINRDWAIGCIKQLEKCKIGKSPEVIEEINELIEGELWRI